MIIGVNKFLKKIHIIIIIGIIAGLTISNITFGREVLPNLKTSGKNIEDFIPKGWVVEDKAYGDLNNDTLKDWALVIQDTNKKNYTTNNNLEHSINANPRILIILFNDPVKNIFVSAEKNYASIIKHNNFTIDDPFDEVSILSNGILKIDFHFLGGGSSRLNQSFKFCYQNKRFELIGIDKQIIESGSGDITNYSFNFITYKMKLTKGNISRDKPDSIEWKKFKVKEKMTLDLILDPFSSKLWDKIIIQP
ncbi:hypothetical protein A2290_08360 [candidate division WOR-1 bacterium RIFOXYB2_FULL_36_35]|uniref:Uncharacterized protein n=1 Tax=candidate division WOR-1 bacterium RIFOXYB2_FULL_36_35 TaxID=1802578 RepID=A0A1F4S1N1_UNCSA|nr:MAG: hypothetical protein A2290_08360 [candidate division WOR-1 bacterium RIFOXYB2_FULL_36_35]